VQATSPAPSAAFRLRESAAEQPNDGILQRTETSTVGQAGQARAAIVEAIRQPVQLHAEVSRRDPRFHLRTRDLIAAAFHGTMPSGEATRFAPATFSGRHTAFISATFAG
jgi:hypothetical protein